MSGCLKVVGVIALIVVGLVLVLAGVGFMASGTGGKAVARPAAPTGYTAASAKICAVSNGDVTYDQLMRNAEEVEGCLVHFQGDVIQTGSDWSGGWIRVRIESDDFATDAVYVRYDHNNKILENDTVRVTGKATGRIEYQTVLGASVTVPAVDSKSVLVVK